MYEIVQKFIKFNRSNTEFTPRGTTLHSTASPGGTAEAEQKYFDTGYRGASAHAFVDWDSIVQTLPWNEKGYHAREPANSFFIGIELCEPKDNDPDRFRKFMETWNRAVWIFAYIHINIIKDPKARIISASNLMTHDEIRILWSRTTHTDPTGFLKKYGKTAAGFRSEVQQEIYRQLESAFNLLGLIVNVNSIECRTGPGYEFPILNYQGKPRIYKKNDKLTAIGEQNHWWMLNVGGQPGYVPKDSVLIIPTLQPIMLEVNASVLNCRKGPGTEYEIIRTFKRGDMLTATGNENGWWKLNLNGQIGFISGMYTTRR